MKQDWQPNLWPTVQSESVLILMSKKGIEISDRTFA